jgi:hypothetical protein
MYGGTGTQRIVNTGKELRKDVIVDNYADTCISATNLKKEQKKTVKKKVWIVDTISANQKEDVNSAEKLKELEEELVFKNATITKQTEVEAKLTAENETMKSLVEKLKRVTKNMSKEIEHLKSTRS